MLVTFAALHEAKRDGTLAQTLAAMTPAERVEAAQVCAANSTRTVSEWLATFGELVEDAGYAVYCEECGVAVNPALAVLDGELMVCQGCAPCSAAEFEAMQMAEAERLMAAEIIEATYPSSTPPWKPTTRTPTTLPCVLPTRALTPWCLTLRRGRP